MPGRAASVSETLGAGGFAASAANEAESAHATMASAARRFIRPDYPARPRAKERPPRQGEEAFLCVGTAGGLRTLAGGLPLVARRSALLRLALRLHGPREAVVADVLAQLRR